MAPTFDVLADLTPPTEVDGVRWYRDVQYALIPGFRPLLLDLSVPTDADGRVPLVILVHGGAWLGGSKATRPRDLDDFDILWPRLLQEGFAVASIQYRLSGEAKFPAQLHDSKAAVRWLRSNAAELDLDPDRIGAVGESAGGHLSVFLGANSSTPDLEGTVGLTGPSSAVAASVGWYPGTRLDTMQEESIPGTPFTGHSEAGSPESLLIGATVADHRQTARYASPIAHISDATAPTLLVHGTHDRIVPHQQSIAYHEALGTAGVSSEIHLIDGADHCFLGGDVDAIIDTTVAFLRARLAVSEYAK